MLRFDKAGLVGTCVDLYFCLHLFVGLKYSIKIRMQKQRKSWVCLHPEISWETTSGELWGREMEEGAAWQILWQTAVNHEGRALCSPGWSWEFLIHQGTKKHTCDTSCFQKRPVHASLLTPHRNGYLLYQDKKKSLAPSVTVTTCHFTLAGTCQRMTHKAATCHPLPEHIKLPFVKHFNGNPEKCPLWARCHLCEGEPGEISFLGLETAEEEATLQVSVKNRPSTLSPCRHSSPTHSLPGDHSGGVKKLHGAFFLEWVVTISA